MVSDFDGATLLIQNVGCVSAFCVTHHCNKVRTVERAAYRFPTMRYARSANASYRLSSIEAIRPLSTGWKSDKRSWWSTHRILEQVVIKRSVIPHWFFRELTFLLSILPIYLVRARRNGPGRLTLKKHSGVSKLTRIFASSCTLLSPCCRYCGTRCSAFELDCQGRTRSSASLPLTSHPFIFESVYELQLPT